MFTITEDKLNSTIIIHDKFDRSATASEHDATPYLNKIGDEYILSFTNLQSIDSFDTFVHETSGTSETRQTKQYYRISRDNYKWGEWLDLNTDIINFPPVDPLDPLFIDIKWVRTGTNTLGSIRILEYSLNGTLYVDVNDNDGVIILPSGESILVKPPYIYKVFKINDVEIISSTGYTDTEILYRFSQDNSRTWSEWEPLTGPNLSTRRITPVRFFQIQYSVTNNSSSTIKIQDINIIGNFQNVTLDYKKSNLYGMRECCQSNLNGSYDENGNFIPNTNLNASGGSSCNGTDIFTSMTPAESSQLYNPYAQNTAIDLLNKLSNDAQQMFGHTVIYFVTDPDIKGDDFSLHEYSLYNVVCNEELKITVENNNFPDSQITFNQFDLNLFESMEVQITKEQFKQKFGVQRRPSKEDIIYFCNLNRLFIVDHAQQFRSFNNTAVYYKLILKKYNQKSNVQAGNTEIKNQLDMLTQNSTIEQLFGNDIQMDKDAIANKQQHTTLTKDPIRLEYNSIINKELIENSSTIVSKSNYDLSTVGFGEAAVEYFNLKSVLKVSDNVGFTCWFNINNYIIDEVYNLFDYHDSTDSIGWNANLRNDKIIVQLNNDEYTFDLLGTNDVLALEEETWYGYVLNIDQRQRTISQYVYKRNVDFEEDAARLSSTILREVYSNTQKMTPVDYEIENINPAVLGSDMRMTNIRLFDEIIPLDQHNKILNEYIIRDDSKYLVFGDNATNKLSLPNYPLHD
jgi:hypothetical protein